VIARCHYINQGF